MAPIPLQQRREAHIARLTKIRDDLEQTKKTAWPFLEKERWVIPTLHIEVEDETNSLHEELRHRRLASL